MKTSKERVKSGHMACNVVFPEERENNFKRSTSFKYEAPGHPKKSTLIKATKRGHFKI